ncbi:MAG: MarR family winged helix-turn-helix transcriptional regulator [Planctomycetota bacterium]|jgi:DNA-binding MarR family transcriptional regulator
MPADSQDTLDYLPQLGMLVLDHRLKRLMLRLINDAQIVYDSQGLDFNARWVSTYCLLQQEPGLPIGEIAARLGISHPMAIKIVGDMEEAGWVCTQADPEDGRRRLVELTAVGRRHQGRLKKIWRALAVTQESLFERQGCAILDVLAGVERELEGEPLAERVIARLRRQRRASSQKEKTR